MDLDTEKLLKVNSQKLDSNKTPYFNVNRNKIDKKEYYCVKLSHIDYMLYNIEYYNIVNKQYFYFKTYNLNTLKIELSKRLIEFSNATKWRNIKFSRKGIKNIINP